jgi:hypothetical protein
MNYDFIAIPDADVPRAVEYVVPLPKMIAAFRSEPTANSFITFNDRKRQ